MIIICTTGWAQEIHLNFEKALQQADEEKKHVLMVFSGSDWCKPCIQLKKEVFQSSIFEQFSANHLVHLELDFPYKKSNRLTRDQVIHNEQLAEEFNPQGAFPKVLIFNALGEVKGELKYKRDMRSEQAILELSSIIGI